MSLNDIIIQRSNVVSDTMIRYVGRFIYGYNNSHHTTNDRSTSIQTTMILSTSSSIPRRWKSQQSSYYDDMSTVTMLIIGTGSCCLAYGSYIFIKSIQLYGFYGTIQYIWDGNPHSELYNQYNDICIQVDNKMKSINKTIQILEETYERAKLETIDYNNNPNNNNDIIDNNNIDQTKKDMKMIIDIWKENLKPYKMNDIQQRLAFINHDIDVSATMVDEIILKSISHYYTNEEYNTIRDKKKLLSKSIVQLMERIDPLVQYYQIATNHE